MSGPDLAATGSADTSATETGATVTTDAPSDDTILQEIWDRDRAGEADATQSATTGTTEKPAVETDARTRGADGKFTTKDTSGKTVAGADQAAAATQQPAPAQSTEAQAPAVLQAPADWSADQKSQFEKVPVEGRALVLEAYKGWQADFGRKTQSLAGERKRYETLNPVLVPIEAEARKFGVSTDVALNALWQAHTELLDPATRLQGMKRIAESYDIDLTAAQNVQLTERTPTPLPAAIPPEFDARLSKVESEIGRGREQEQETALRTDAKIAQDWGDEKAADGAPLRPHLAAVLAEVTDLIGVVRKRKPSAPFAEVLQDAYETACAANPAIRQKMVDDAAAKKSAETINADRARGTKAANASAAHVSRSGSSRVAPASETDTDRILSEIWNKGGYGTA